jgi:hypothetical protein
MDAFCLPFDLNDWNVFAEEGVYAAAVLSNAVLVERPGRKNRPRVQGDAAMSPDAFISYSRREFAVRLRRSQMCAQDLPLPTAGWTFRDEEISRAPSTTVRRPSSS